MRIVEAICDRSLPEAFSKGRELLIAVIREDFIKPIGHW
jgi:hypothetical protein